MKRHLLTLLHYTDRTLFEPLVAGPPDELLAEIRAAGFRTFPVPLKGELDPIQDLRSVSLLVSLLRRERVTILHAHGAKAGLVGRLAGLWARTPILLVTVHNSIFAAEWPRWKKRVFAAAEAILARWTSRIITVSEALRQEIIKCEKLRPAQLVTIYNGIEPDLFCLRENREALRSHLGLPVNQPVVITVARLASQKGIRYLVEAAALFPPEHRPFFLVVGDGPLRGELVRQAATLGVNKHLFFTGSRNDLPQLLNAADLLVLPSLTEGLGLVLLEAMAASLPVVATRVGGIPEVVVDGETGILVPPRDPAALAQAIEILLANPERARAMGAAGRERVRRFFTVEKMARSVMALYREELQRRGFLSMA